jgi:hypothetical protein
MLIVLDTTIEARLAELQGQQSFRAAMRNLALGYREGKHVVTAPRSLLDRLMHLATLDQPTRETFQQIKARYRDGQLLRKRVRRYILVCGGAESIVVTTAGGPQTAIRVSYDLFDDSGWIQPSVLLAEDADDARFYELVACAYVAQEKQLSGIDIRCSKRGGGGSSTEDQLDAAANERFTICIVDSDRDWPGANHGHTARKVVKAGGRLRASHRVAEVHVLPCREVENLLPGPLVLDALPSTTAPALRGRIADASDAGVFGRDELFRYLDIKNGLSLCDVLGAQPQAKQDFLRAVYSRIGRPSPEERPCQDVCRGTRNTPCSRFERLGDHLFQYVVSHAAEQTPHKLAGYLFSRKQQESDCGPIWTELGEVLLAWTCAFKPIRA